MGLWGKRRGIYAVTVHIDGRHPYLEGHDLDTETRDVVLHVPARDWNDAANQALRSSMGIKGWRYSVSSITSGRLALAESQRK